MDMEEKTLDFRNRLKEKQRIVIKIGSSSLMHKNTGAVNLQKLEILVRVLTNLRNQGKDVILVSSGAIAVGKRKVRLIETENDEQLAYKQACAAIGQAQLMMIYQKLFAEYNQIAAQVLMTNYTMIRDESRKNAQNTFQELLKLGVIPIVNENDTVSTHEIEFGDNDRLSAIVAALVHADLLILMSDIDGLFTDDPNNNPEADFIKVVTHINEDLIQCGKSTSGSKVGTGGMSAKISAARIATDSGADMVIANGDNVHVIEKILEGKDVGTLFVAHKNKDFDLMDYIKR